MKTFFSVFSILAILLSFNTAAAQEEQPSQLTEADWQAIIPHLEAEEWEQAEKLAADYLKRFKGEKELWDEAGIVRYMYMATVAAQLGDKEISKEDAIKKLKGFEGKNVVTPLIMYKKDGMFNYFKIEDEAEEGKSKRWVHCMANENATVIHIFDYFEMADPALIDDEVLVRLEGKLLRVSAKIKEIRAEGNAMPRLAVEYTDGDIYDLIEPEE